MATYKFDWRKLNPKYFDIRVLFVIPILNTANYEMSFFNFYQKD